MLAFAGLSSAFCTRIKGAYALLSAIPSMELPARP